jgi:hypothetical protein
MYINAMAFSSTLPVIYKKIFNGVSKIKDNGNPSH